MPNRKTIYVLVALLAATFALTACEHAAVGVVYVGPPPPPLIAEPVLIAPGPGYAWVPGYQMWNGTRYVWVPGRYELRPAGMHRWVPGHWRHNGRGWYWMPGHWR